jgi:Cys-tRNA(Pro)/Cys-tRNA(Cys) deacylase
MTEARIRLRSRSGGGTPAVDVLRRQNVTFELHAYTFGGDAGIALEAAEALGIAPARILKTLMASVDGGLMVALVPADRGLNLKALAAAIGGKRAEMADIRQAERASGYVKGGISPFGQRQRSPAVVDGSVRDHSSVFVNGGRRGLEIELAPDALIEALAAEVAPIARLPAARTGGHARCGAGEPPRWRRSESVAGCAGGRLLR